MTDECWADLKLQEIQRVTLIKAALGFMSPDCPGNEIFEQDRVLTPFHSHSCVRRTIFN